ncbi:splicing factor Cactin [Primulina tabacum]|uniref:splicing factor Cactin n=1 Tax=Primulina tabacum TaxID=48773 RepID=UPI003F597AFD
MPEANKRDALERARVRGEQLPPEITGEERGLHASIEADVKNLLQGKTYGELEALQSQIESQMRSGSAKVVEYWEVIIKRLHIYKAKACLKEIHVKMLHMHLERLKEQNQIGFSIESVIGRRYNSKTRMTNMFRLIVILVNISIMVKLID